MAINKAMRLALKALSYSDVIDDYRIKRAATEMKSPHVFRAVYEKWDRTVICNGIEVNVRVYPVKGGNTENAILFFHGGGWVTESVNTYNNVCKTMAARLGRRVISVDYSLAPENPFPKGLHDCYAVAKELFTQPEILGLRSDKIVVIGDSAGGNLAAATALMARDRGEFKIEKQVLIYPAVGNDHSENSRFDSVRENGTDYLLTSKAVTDFMELYKSKDEDYNDPYFAPLLAEDLTNQPKTLIITAEYDPLRDEGEAYGRKLKAAGNEVTMYRMKDALHGFFSMSYTFSQVRRAYDYISRFIGD